MIRYSIIQSPALRTAALLLACLASAGSASAGDRESVLQKAPFSGHEKQEVGARADAARANGIPAEDIDLIVSRGIERGARPETIIHYLDLSSDMQRQGLPVDAVLDRIHQGLAKHVQPARIASSADRLSLKLKEARPLVDELIGAGLTTNRTIDRTRLITQTALGMEASLTRDQIRRINAAVHAKQGSSSLFVRAVGTAANLARQGGSNESASRSVINALKNGNAEQSLAALEKGPDSGSRRGSPTDNSPQQTDQGFSRNSDRGHDRGASRADHGRSSGGRGK